MFKKIISIVLLGVMMATLMSMLLGCEDVDKKTVAAIQTKLEEKYNKSFTVHALGNRIGYDTVTAYVYADEDPSIFFTARLNKNKELDFDNYGYRLLCRKTELLLNETFRKYGVEGLSFCNFERFDNASGLILSPAEYVAATNSTYVSLAFAVNGKGAVTSEKILNAVDELYRELNTIDLHFSIFILSADDYSRVYDSVLHETQTFTFDRLVAYGAKDSIAEIGFLYNNVGCSLSIEDINAEIAKGAE